MLNNKDNLNFEDVVVGAGTGAVGELLCCRGYFGLLYSSRCYKVGGGGVLDGWWWSCCLPTAREARLSTRQTDWASTSWPGSWLTGRFTRMSRATNSYFISGWDLDCFWCQCISINIMRQIMMNLIIRIILRARTRGFGWSAQRLVSLTGDLLTGLHHLGYHDHYCRR